MILVPKRASSPVGVIKDDGDSGLGDTRLPLLVDELLEVGSADLLQIGDAQDEANGVEYVGLAGAVEASDGVEVRVKSRNHGPRRVRLETFQAYLLYVHLLARCFDQRKKKIRDQDVRNCTDGAETEKEIEAL